MRPPPPGIPGAHSRKWRGRRLWDGLGYLRVRSMANPAWERDLARVVRLLEFDRDRPTLYGSAEDRPLYDEALAAARRYPRTAAGAVSPEGAWDEVLAAVDRILVVRQARHLAAVREGR